MALFKELYVKSQIKFPSAVTAEGFETHKRTESSQKLEHFQNKAEVAAEDSRLFFKKQSDASLGV